MTENSWNSHVLLEVQPLLKNICSGGGGVRNVEHSRTD